MVTAPLRSLSKGQLLGGRFSLTHASHRSARIERWFALDQKAERSVLLHILTPRKTMEGPQRDRLKQRCREASHLLHPSIATTFGMGQNEDGRQFIVSEALEAPDLLSWIEGARFPSEQGFRKLQSFLETMQAALSFAEALSPHGALHPGLIRCMSEGSLKIEGFGVESALLGIEGFAAADLLPPSAQAYVAPEVWAGAAAAPASDVYSLACLSHALLVGHPPRAKTGPRELDASLSPLLIEVLDHATKAEAELRFQKASEFVAALAAAIERAASEAGIANPGARRSLSLEIDLEEGVHQDAPTQVDPPMIPNPSPSSGKTASAPPARGDSSEVVRLLARFERDQAARWTVIKDKLEHGPFSAHELAALMLKGEVLAQHAITNLDNGERRLAKEYPIFSDFLRYHQRQSDEEAKRAALARSEKGERVSNMVKWAAVSGIALCLLGLALFLAMRRKNNDAADVDYRKLAALYERGDVKVKGSAGLLEGEKGDTRRRGKGGKRGPGGAGDDLSYDEAMQRAVDLGDVSQGASERQLSSAEVAKIMNQHISKLFSCVSTELRNGGKLQRVDIDLALAGSGKVLGASIHQGGGEFQQCVAAKVRAIRFPSFQSARMGARYSFTVE